MYRPVLVLTIALGCLHSSNEAHATCGNNLTCEATPVRADCSPAPSTWPADEALRLKVLCSDYCSYFDQDNVRQTMTRSDVPVNEFMYYLTIRKGDSEVEGDFEDEQKTCGKHHLIRFATLLEPGERYTVAYPYSDLKITVGDLVGCGMVSAGAGAGRSGGSGPAALVLCALLLGLCLRARGR